MNGIAKIAECEIRADLEPDRWDQFVASQERANFYQRYGWREVVEKSFGHRTYFLSALRGKEVVGVVPLAEIRSRLFGHSLVSTPFCVGGGPLFEDKLALGALLARTEELGRELGVDYIEIRDAQDIGRGWIAKEGLYAGFERGIAVAEDECLKQIPRKQRAVVRHALSNGLSHTTDKDVSTFFRLHSRTFRDHGTPVFPRRYYQNLVDVFGQDCDILTVWNGSEPVSTVMSFYLRGRVTPYYTGSVDAARGLGANDLMYWQLMRHAVSRGYTSFDFGRSKVGTGPYAFKKNWGFEPRPIVNWYYLLNQDTVPNVNPTNPKYALAIKVWRNLPLPLANFLAQLISPNLA